MSQDIWFNLPVKDLAKSAAFFTAIGFARHPGAGNTEQSASFTIGEKGIILMLFTQEMFSGFTQHALSDTAAGTEVLFSLGADSRKEVEDMAASVKSAGGTIFGEPRAFNDFMHGCGFCDLDGHRWNVLFMDPGKMSG